MVAGEGRKEQEVSLDILPLIFPYFPNWKNVNAYLGTLVWADSLVSNKNHICTHHLNETKAFIHVHFTNALSRVKMQYVVSTHLSV